MDGNAKEGNGWGRGGGGDVGVVVKIMRRLWSSESGSTTTEAS